MTKQELSQKLEKTLEYLGAELAKIRTGRASTSLIEGIVVNAYGSNMKIKEVGSVTVLDTQNLVVSPWDKSLLDPVAKAIRESGTGLNPVVDGDVVRVPVPPLTEERRKEYAKIATTKVEEAKESVRRIRQEAMKDIDKMFSSKEITEDDKFSMREDIEEEVKSAVAKADEAGENKKSDLMSV